MDGTSDREPREQIDFLFVGGNLGIDLVNTRRMRRLSGPRRVVEFDQLWNAAQTAAWWNEARSKHRLGPDSSYGWNDSDFAQLLNLRRELRDLFGSVVSGARMGDDLPLLNRILAGGSFSFSMTGMKPSRIYSWREGRFNPLLTVVLATLDLLVDQEVARVRICRSDECGLLFYDGTKSGTRQWCRPDCMNRARARANYRTSSGSKRRVESRRAASGTAQDAEPRDNNPTSGSNGESSDPQSGER